MELREIAGAVYACLQVDHGLGYISSGLVARGDAPVDVLALFRGMHSLAAHRSRAG